MTYQLALVLAEASRLDQYVTGFLLGFIAAGVYVLIARGGKR